MNKYQAMTKEFNDAILSEASAELRVALIKEEAKETIKAVAEEDPVGTIDGLCDLLYVTYGAACVFGLELNTTDEENSPILKLDWPKIQDNIDDLETCAHQACEAIYSGNKHSMLMYLQDLAEGCWLMAAEGLGLDLRPFFEEVHRTNMAKLGGPRRADGKQLKPADWKPPRIAEMYKALFQ